MTAENIIKSDNVAAILDRVLDAGEVLLRLTPTWVPRSFLHPGRRLRYFGPDTHDNLPEIGAYKN